MADDLEYGGVNDYYTSGGRLRYERKKEKMYKEAIAHDLFDKKYNIRKSIEYALYELEQGRLEHTKEELKQLLKNDFLSLR